MKTSIMALALGIVLASHVEAYAGGSLNLPNVSRTFSPDRITANGPIMRPLSCNGATHSSPAEPTG